MQEPFQAAIAAWELQKVVIKRRTGCRGHEPVSTQGRNLGPGIAVDGFAVAIVRAIGINERQSLPQGRSPFVSTQIDAQNGPVGNDRFRKSDARVPGQAVEQFAGRLTGGLQVLRRSSGMSQMGQGQVARETALARIELFQIGQNDAGYFPLGNPFGNHDLAIKRERPGVDPALQHL